MLLGSQEKNVHEIAPVIAEAPKRITVDPGHEAVISATVRGFPEPAIAWTRNDETIVTGDKCQVAISSDHSFFSFFLTFLSSLILGMVQLSRAFLSDFTSCFFGSIYLSTKQNLIEIVCDGELTKFVGVYHRSPSNFDGVVFMGNVAQYTVLVFLYVCIFLP